jgi:hypothetical protein
MDCFLSDVTWLLLHVPFSWTVFCQMLRGCYFTCLFHGLFFVRCYVAVTSRGSSTALSDSDRNSLEMSSLSPELQMIFNL